MTDGRTDGFGRGLGGSISQVQLCSTLCSTRNSSLKAILIMFGAFIMRENVLDKIIYKLALPHGFSFL